ncbi:MAG: hypothetical protein IJR60_04450 [Eubacterium sp.]|nr:hypothetical protein [Eubacterium sp.]
MKNDYFENDGADTKRKKRKKKKKERKALKGFLVFISMVVVGLTVFVITVKLLAPDFDFSTLVPKKAYTFVDEKIMGHTTTTEPTTTTTTEPTTAEPTTAKRIDYLEFDEFEMNTERQGNAMGNLMNGGQVATDYSYIYHITTTGIYRINPETEDYARIYETKDKLSSLNLRGDFLYFVNEKSHELLKMEKGSSEPSRIAKDVRFAYVYDNKIFYVTTGNTLCVMAIKDMKPSQIYSSADNELRLVGISLKRVFFAVTNGLGKIDYLTVELDDEERAVAPFRDSEENSDSKLVMENGFMYYYTPNGSGTYNVCRQKFGSEQVVTLAEDSDASSYIEVDSNRLFYPEYKDGSYMLTEVNMNSGDSRYLMTIKDVDSQHQLKYYHSYQYDFVIGKTAADGKDIYRAGCVFTGSTHYMKFNKGNWSY